jgi:hypothetical protein
MLLCLKIEAKPASEMPCFFNDYTIKIQKKKKTVSGSHTSLPKPKGVAY